MRVNIWQTLLTVSTVGLLAQTAVCATIPVRRDGADVASVDVGVPPEPNFIGCGRSLKSPSQNEADTEDSIFARGTALC
ncbi:hypothetical protein BV25DRAFT_1831736 [Artomyces pyxidatus]|uniref:Uncharacterized protein n=1 Tax=Artomyces pyxidatus TaxID=48021 RepID=A0ACB8SL35_9AGAM|nr:hypothetical protein BV25DRAFT_1831736 [Artomyces pyxidatus]